MSYTHQPTTKIVYTPRLNKICLICKFNENYVIISYVGNRAVVACLPFTKVGGDCMKDTFKTLMLIIAFGMFLIALLTFIFQFA